MKKSSILSLVISVMAFALSAAALVIGVIALVKACGGNKISASEYNFAVPDDDDEYENLGSDTLAF